MRIYLDDSGDPGLRLGRRGGRSSPYLCIAAVLTNDYLALEEAVQGFREDRAWAGSREIKFEDTSDANTALSQTSGTTSTVRVRRAHES